MCSIRALAASSSSRSLRRDSEVRVAETPGDEPGKITKFELTLLHSLSLSHHGLHEIVHHILIIRSSRLSWRLSGSALAYHRRANSSCRGRLSWLGSFKDLLKLGYVLFIYGGVGLLHVVKPPLLRVVGALEHVDSSRALFDLIKFEITREDVDLFHRVLGFSVTPLELVHALGILGHSDQTLPPVGFDLSGL
jgi:hypothetical protein